MKPIKIKLNIREVAARTLGVLKTYFSAILLLIFLAAVAAWGTNQGQLFGLDRLLWLWVISALLAVALYPAVRWFAELKARRRDIAWLKYL